VQVRGSPGRQSKIEWKVKDIVTQTSDGLSLVNSDHGFGCIILDAVAYLKHPVGLQFHGIEIDEDGCFCMRVIKRIRAEREEEEEMRLTQGEAASAFKPRIRRRVISRSIKRGRS
jgi:hypothetical protein